MFNISEENSRRPSKLVDFIEHKENGRGIEEELKKLPKEARSLYYERQGWEYFVCRQGSGH